MPRLVSLWLTIGLVLATVPESHAATLLRKVVIGHAALNARVAPLWIADDQGFFAKYGV